jgi:hypothetical protein
MQEDDYGPYDVLVVGDLIATQQSRSRVLGNKDFYRRRFRNLHVSVRNRLGHSVDLELFK